MKPGLKATGRSNSASTYDDKENPMASDFQYDGVKNHMHAFKDRSTGVEYHVMTTYDDESVTLLDGDEVEFQHPQMDKRRYSIRQDRRI